MPGTSRLEALQTSRHSIPRTIPIFQRDKQAQRGPKTTPLVGRELRLRLGACPWPLCHLAFSRPWLLPQGAPGKHQGVPLESSKLRGGNCPGVWKAEHKRVQLNRKGRAKEKVEGGLMGIRDRVGRELVSG